MSDEERTHAADAEHVSFRLAEGLKACRAVVANYRAMLGAEANDNGPEARPESAFFEVAVPCEADEA